MATSAPDESFDSYKRLRRVPHMIGPQSSRLAKAMTQIVRRLAVRAWQMRTESLVALLNLATVAAGFLLQIVVLRLAGASRDADAYFAAAAIPQFILAIAANTLTGALMPQLARIDEATRSATTRTMLMLVMCAGLPIAITLYFTATMWTPLIFPGFAGGNAPVSIALAGLAALSGPFAVATSVLSAHLYAQRRFLTNESIAFGTTAALSAAAILLIPRHGVVVLGWLILGRFMTQLSLQCLCLPIGSVTAGWPFLNPVLQRSRPLLAGALYFKSDVLVDRYMLSLAPAGTLSIIVFGQSLFLAASGILGQALANTASPTLSVAHSSGDFHHFYAILRRNLALILFASIILVIVGVVFIPPITLLITKHASTNGSINIRLVLILFSGVPIGACAGSLLAHAFYSMGDTRTPTFMSAATFTAFIFSKVIIFKFVGLYAFCALTSIYYLSNGAILALLLRRRLRRETAK